jgi:outer membrane protein assembly factor BamE (lipoprotein component of BamABCDE complex)
MKKLYKIFFLTLFLSSFSGCQTISTKVDKATQKEEQELSKWIGKTEAELTSSLGKPDRIDFRNSRNRYYVYVSQKLKIKCERKFEITQNNVVLGFSSKNCF